MQACLGLLGSRGFCIFANMRKFFFISFLLVFSCGMHDIFGEENNMAKALQEALALGSKTAAKTLGTPCEKGAVKCATGYLGNELVEILLPDTDYFRLASSFSGIPGVSQYLESIKTALNRGAEQAAGGSIEVFEKVIFGLSFRDAREILLGNDTAATSYLHEETYFDLRKAFAPVIREPLNLLNPNQYWKPVASAYNSLASTKLPEDISEYLSDYATGKALDGLFKMVGLQEAKLRQAPKQAVSEAIDLDLISGDTGNLLIDIFGRAQKGSL